MEDRVDGFIEWRWKYSPNCAKSRYLGKDRDLAASLIWELEVQVPDGLWHSQGGGSCANTVIVAAVTTEGVMQKIMAGMIRRRE